jgi:hypothetical protein
MGKSDQDWFEVFFATWRLRVFALKFGNIYHRLSILTGAKQELILNHLRHGPRLRARVMQFIAGLADDGAAVKSEGKPVERRL